MTRPGGDNVSAVVLAAGRGSRLGIPKAILEVGSRPLAALQAENLRKAGIGRVHIVIGCEHEKVATKLRASDASGKAIPALSLVVNKDWQSGQFSSLKAGISAAHKGNWVLVMPVDTVGVKKETIETILKIAARGTDADAVVPSFRGKRGHPVLLSPKLCRRISRMDARKSRLDHVLHASKTVVVDVADKAVLANVNTRADLAKLSGKGT